MKETMLGKIMIGLMTIPAEWLGVLVDLIEKLGGKCGVEFFAELRKFCRKQPCWVNKTTQAKSQPAPSILKLVSQTTIPAITSEFVPEERFNLGYRRDDNFKDWFLTGNSKEEYPTVERVLNVYSIENLSMPSEINFALGGVENSKTTLYEMFHLIKHQLKGATGPLLNNGFDNIFFIEDVRRILRIVRVRWSSDGENWNISADSPIFPKGPVECGRVFSRK